MRPQRAGRVFEQLGLELLPAEPGAFVFANDLIEKCRRQVSAIFVARAAGHDTDRVRTRSRINFAGRGVVVTTVRGSAPSRIPTSSLGHVSRRLLGS